MNNMNSKDLDYLPRIRKREDGNYGSIKAVEIAEITMQGVIRGILLSIKGPLIRKPIYVVGIDAERKQLIVSDEIIDETEEIFQQNPAILETISLERILGYRTIKKIE